VFSGGCAKALRKQTAEEKCAQITRECRSALNPTLSLQPRGEGTAEPTHGFRVLVGNSQVHPEWAQVSHWGYNCVKREGQI
jgi:hypothetical protein